MQDKQNIKNSIRGTVRTVNLLLFVMVLAADAFAQQTDAATEAESVSERVGAAPTQISAQSRATDSTTDETQIHSQSSPQRNNQAETPQADAALVYERDEGDESDESNKNKENIKRDESVQTFSAENAAKEPSSEKEADASTNTRNSRETVEQAPVDNSPSDKNPIKKENTESAVNEPAENDSTREPVEAPVSPRLRPRIDPGPSLINRDSIPPMPTLDFTDHVKSNPDVDYEARELLLVSSGMQAARDAAATLRSYQLQVRSRQIFENLDLVITRFRLPPDSDVLQMRAMLQKRHPEYILDTNQRYELLSSRRQRWAQHTLEWPSENSRCINKKSLRLGMVDTGVDTTHPALVGARVSTQAFVEGELAPSLHGTAIASLFVGKDETGNKTPGKEQAGVTGLLPSAELFAANVFRSRAGKNETNTFALVRALEWLSAQNPEVINLSLGGKENRVFASVLDAVMAKGVILVAAAGNGGPEAAPVYPAAQEGVIAVTAVDAQGRIYRSANQGEYIDFAAPGVEIWAANAEKRGQYHSGTSFAAPFVSAILTAAKNNRGRAELLALLQTEVSDSGLPGRDNVFGWGLVKVPAECRD